MPAPHAPHLLLLLLAALLPTALACHIPRSLPAHGLHLLRTMAPNSTCQQQLPPFFHDAFPHNRHHQNLQHRVFAILSNLLHTLSSNRIPQQWNNPARDDLLNTLDQHTRRLQQCLKDNTTLLTLNINRYFRRIHSFLSANNHSDCAWHHVYLEARLCFQHLHNLTSTTHN